MFGLGFGEIIVILIVALLVLGPEKLPEAAKTIGKTIRELRKHTDNLKETIEQDEHIGGTVRELKSALRGDPLLPNRIQKPQGAVAQNAPSDETKIGEKKPDEAKPGEAKPADAKPDEAKAADAKPVEAKADEAKAADAKPVEAKLEAKAEETPAVKAALEDVKPPSDPKHG
jgi:sec-independent protein translocase protein TatB